MRRTECARAGGTPLQATPFAAFPLLAIKNKETKKKTSYRVNISTVAGAKTSNQSWFNIGSAGWVNIQSAQTSTGWGQIFLKRLSTVQKTKSPPRRAF